MRTITNPVGDELRAALKSWRDRISDEFGDEAGERFERMMLDTWTTTMSRNGEGIFVITGDIPAMWLRDSSAQLRPYLLLAAPADEPRDGDERGAEACREVADTIHFMDGGTILESGPPEVVLDRPEQARTAEFLRRFPR